MNNLKKALYLLAAIWLVYFLNLILPFELNNLGIYPRSISGLKGILFSPFLHANLIHFISNSVPLFILSLALFYFYPKRSGEIIAIIVVLGGFFVWLLGRSAVHVGASGLIYGLAAFHISNGLFRKEVKSLLISIVTIFMYGGLIWGVLPVSFYVSWEGHLFGACAGVFAAYSFRKKSLN